MSHASDPEHDPGAAPDGAAGDHGVRGAVKGAMSGAMSGAVSGAVTGATAGAARGAGAAPRTLLGGGVPRWAIIGIFLLLAFQAVTVARAFLMPVLLALLLTLVFTPVRRAMGRWRVPAGAAAGLIVTTLVATIGVLAVLLVAPVTNLVDDGPRIFAEVEEKLSGLRDAAGDVAEVAATVDQVAAGGAAGEAEETAAAATGEEAPERVVVEERGAVMTLAMAAPAVLAQIVLTLVLLFFLLASGDMFVEKVVHVIPRFADKRRAVRIARDIESRLSRYLLTISIINAGLGASIGLAMWAMGMPTPLLFAVIGFLFNFVPYLGAVAGVAIAVAVAIVSLDTVGAALAVGAIYFALTSIEGQFVTPYFVGRSLKLNVVVVFLSVTLWAWLWSVVGMLVATPVLVALRTLCEHIPSLEPLGDFLSARGEERDPDRAERAEDEVIDDPDMPREPAE